MVNTSAGGDEIVFEVKSLPVTIKTNNMKFFNESLGQYECKSNIK